LQKKIKENSKIEEHFIFMAICETCGHDRRGNSTTEDDVSLVSEKYFEFAE
jgi:type I restriction enzyme M protein